MENTIESIKQVIDRLPNQYVVVGYDEAEELQILTYSVGLSGLFGMNEEEFSDYIRKDALKKMFSQNRDTMAYRIKKCTETGQPCDLIYCDSHKTKGRLWLHVKVCIFANSNGKPLYYASVETVDAESEICQTIWKINANYDSPGLIESRQQEKETYHNTLKLLKEVQQDKNMIITAAKVMFPMCISVNLSKNSYYMIEYDRFNAKKAAGCGQFDELIQVGLTTIHDDDKSKFLRAFSRENLMKAYKRGEKVVSLTHKQMGVDGQWHWNRTTAIFVENSMSDDILQVTVTDCVDDQKRAEDELKQKERQLKHALEEAKKANRAKSAFLSSMSHDIRTPLNAILNLTNLLQDEMDQPEMLEADIQKIRVAGEFLLQLINDILDVSAIESGKMTLSPAHYAYQDFVNYIQGIIVPLCERKKINFVFDSTAEGPDLYIDRVRFHQIFFNILSNAVKYTHQGGTITFQLLNVEKHEDVFSCDFVTRDSGCGMSSEFCEKVFEPFEREDMQNAYVGSGLGLTICKEIVDLMGGRVSIESKQNEGTTVSVHLDLQIATEEQCKECHLVKNNWENGLTNRADCRILVVEDNDINREILYRILKKRGFSVESAENGKEAVEKVRKHCEDYYQLIFMDVRMPVMNGLEATALIRQEESKKKSSIPIVAVTANAFEQDVDECLAAGMDAYLSKPIAENELYEIIATYV